LGYSNPVNGMIQIISQLSLDKNGIYESTIFRSELSEDFHLKVSIATLVVD
jgi:hypothetical protein